jgi:hypothetical protein
MKVFYQALYPLELVKLHLVEPMMVAVFQILVDGDLPATSLYGNRWNNERVQAGQV